jgi:hypothetical protein
VAPGEAHSAGPLLGVKTQWVRVADVLFVGPVMVWGGLKLGGVLGFVLGTLGVMTIVYNGRNYVLIAREEAARLRAAVGAPELP